VLFLARSQHLGRDVVIAFGFIGLLFLLHSHFGLGEGSLEFADLQRLSRYRNGMASSRWAHTGYLSNVDLTNPVELALFMPAGLLYFLFAPFPWQISSFRQLLALPEMLAWYWTVPCVWAAFKPILRDRTHRRLALLLPLLVITFAYTLGTGNSGTAYRYRSQIVTIYLIFAAGGYLERRKLRQMRLLGCGR
jgi:hypothetical protein